MSQADLEKTLNLGVGMVAVVDPDDVEPRLSVLEEHAVHAWVCGEVAMAGDAGRTARRGDAGGPHPGW